MNNLQLQTKCWMKEARNKRAHIIWSHLYKVPTQAKVICVVRSQALHMVLHLPGTLSPPSLSPRSFWSKYYSSCHSWLRSTFSGALLSHPIQRSPWRETCLEGGTGGLGRFCFLLWVLRTSVCSFCKNASRCTLTICALFCIYVIIHP